MKSLDKQTTINFDGDIKMSEPWKGYDEHDIFTIIRKTKGGLYILRDKNGNENPLKKSNINYFINL
jgi:hypothetical protein